MRGKLRTGDYVYVAVGITPAGAGKTLYEFELEHVERDHPRRCGENHHIPQNAQQIAGSPPQVRGKQHVSFFETDISGITPAGAGKTPPGGILRLSEQDHPRRCGENSFGNVKYFFDLGSPPQVRGKPITAGAASKSRGITPAGAGKTRGLCHLRQSTGDHPRRCGENRQYIFMHR